MKTQLHGQNGGTMLIHHHTNPRQTIAIHFSEPLEGAYFWEIDRNANDAVINDVSQKAQLHIDGYRDNARRDSLRETLSGFRN